MYFLLDILLALYLITLDIFIFYKIIGRVESFFVGEYVLATLLRLWTRGLVVPWIKSRKDIKKFNFYLIL